MKIMKEKMEIKKTIYKTVFLEHLVRLKFCLLKTELLVDHALRKL